MLLRTSETSGASESPPFEESFLESLFISEWYNSTTCGARFTDAMLLLDAKFIGGGGGGGGGGSGT